MGRHHRCLRRDLRAVDATEEAPTTLAYNSYLLAATLGGSYAEGVGTVLPCYWIYGWPAPQPAASLVWSQEMTRAGSTR